MSKSWCWVTKRKKLAIGKFSSLEECKEHFNTVLPPGVKVRVYETSEVSPKEWAYMGLNFFLRRMDNNIADEFGFCGSIFEVKATVPREVVRLSLRKCLSEWAKQFVQADGKWIPNLETEQVFYSKKEK